MAYQVSTDDSTISSGDQQEKDSPPSTLDGEYSGKKSLLGKLKDKTMTKVSQLKQKVSKKKAGGSGSDEDEETTTAAKSAPDTAIESAPESTAVATPSRTEDAASDLSLRGDDTKPISQYRNEGPTGIMQAVPTQYRDYASERFQPAQLDSTSPMIQAQEPSEYLSEAREIPADVPIQSTSKKVEDADAQIPEGIEKPKDFDTVAYSHDTSGTLSPSDQSGEITAGDQGSVEAAGTPQQYETKSHQETAEELV